MNFSDQDLNVVVPVVKDGIGSGASSSTPGISNSATSSATTTKRIAWRRVLRVILTSQDTKRQMIFTEDQLAISVEGYKYMSVLNDECTIKITNLSYSEIVRIISGKFYDVEVQCGYKSGLIFTIFKGGVLYISNDLNDRKSNIVTIQCASNIIAKFGQSRINLSLRSGINVYSAMNFICKQAGITNANISKSFKLKFTQEVINSNDTVGNWIENLTAMNSSYISNSDDSTNSALTLFDAQRDSQKVHKLSNDSIDLTGGYPRLNTSGLSLTLMPTRVLSCGDLIQLDNAYININAGTRDEAYKNYGYFLDPNGQYMIWQIHYVLENRDSSFSMELQCKSRSLLMNIVQPK